MLQTILGFAFYGILPTEKATGQQWGGGEMYFSKRRPLSFELQTNPAHFPGLPSTALVQHRSFGWGHNPSWGRNGPTLTSSSKGCSPSLAHQPQAKPLWVAPGPLVPCPGRGRSEEPGSERRLGPAEGARAGTAPAPLSFTKGSAPLATLSNSCLFWRLSPPKALLPGFKLTLVILFKKKK